MPDAEERKTRHKNTIYTGLCRSFQINVQDYCSLHDELDPIKSRARPWVAFASICDTLSITTKAVSCLFSVRCSYDYSKEDISLGLRRRTGKKDRHCVA